MKFRHTLIALIVLCGLILYFFLIEKPLKKKEGEKEKAKTVFNFDPANVERIIIERADKGKVSFKKLEEDWVMEEPFNVDADNSIVDSIATRIGKLDIEKVVAENLQSLEAFGLDKPSYIVTLYLRGTTVPAVLKIGKFAPVGFKMYALKEGDEKVILVSGGVETNLKKDVVDYRERKLHDFLVSEVSDLYITKREGNKKFSFARVNDEWWIKEPIDARADGDTIRRALTALRDLRAKEFVDDAPSSLDKYGLEKPAYVVKVVLEQNKGEFTFYFGERVKGKSEVYAKTEKMKNVVSVDSEIISKIDKELYFWRVKQIFDFYTWKAEKFTIQDKFGTTTVIKDKKKNIWTDESGKDKKDSDAVNEILRIMRDIKAVEYVADKPVSLKTYSLDAPSIKFKVLIEGEVEEREINFGETTAHGIYAMVKNDPTVYLVDKKFLEEYEKNRFKILSEEEAGRFSPPSTTSVEEKK